MAILLCDPEQIVDAYREEYTAYRKELKAWAYSQIETQESYQKAFSDVLFKDHTLNKLVDSFAMASLQKNALDEKSEAIKKLQAELNEEKTSHEERRLKQYELIQKKEEENESLRNKLSNFEKCKRQLDEVLTKYQAQVSMNERLIIENERRLSEILVNNQRMKEDIAEKTTQLEDLTTAHTALEADYALKSGELLRLKDSLANKETSARTSVLQELITKLNEQLYYLTLFYLELKDNGKLEEESIELFGDTLNNIDEALESFGIKKIGVILQKDVYDASIHSSTESGIANGDSVVYEGYGWKIGNEVYIKAPVEKGEE